MTEIIASRAWIRPTVDRDFYKFTDEVQAYINETYVQTGKRKSIVWNHSEDQLTFTVESHWVSQEALQEFLSDPKIIESGILMEAYNSAHNIVQSTDNRPHQS